MDSEVVNPFARLPLVTTTTRLFTSQYHVSDRHVQRFRRAAFSSTDRIRLLRLTALKLIHLMLFGCFLFPWMLCAAPVSLLLSVGSDQKAKEAQKMSVKGTWKVLLAPFGLILLHTACSVAIGMSFGEIAVLAWFFFGNSRQRPTSELLPYLPSHAATNRLGAHAC